MDSAYHQAYYRARRKQILARRELYRMSPRGRYGQQRFHAKRRGIAREFTFDSWWKIVEPVYKERGRLDHQLCMARKGDVGPYAPGNVKMISNLDNKQGLF